MKINCKICSKQIEIPPSAVKAGRICCSRFCSSKYKWSNPDYRDHMKKVHKPIKENIDKLIQFAKSKEGRKLVSNRLKGKIPWNKGKKLPQTSGKNHYLWKEDRTQLKKYFGSNEKRSPIYKNWRKNVIMRDEYKCKINNIECSGRLEAHHILGWTEFPELRYQINNGITLCHFHHPRVRKEEKRLIPTFKELVSVSK